MYVHGMYMEWGDTDEQTDVQIDGCTYKNCDTIMPHYFQKRSMKSKPNHFVISLIFKASLASAEILFPTIIPVMQRLNSVDCDLILGKVCQMLSRWMKKPLSFHLYQRYHYKSVTIVFSIPGASYEPTLTLVAWFLAVCLFEHAIYS